ncbi:MAG TPA: PorP/SprF family type IX secretion system membrane protein, partial [Nitrosopumilaceae archaeon]|nr:PorP/SprF family type IX secretion system membrane protein [Nitrosopumilaceae archaeon]
MRKTLTILAIALGGYVTTAYSQQDPQFTQFMNTKLSYNPAFAGTNGAICFNALYRQQWVNFPGAPKTGSFNFDMPLLSTFGVGLTVVNDQLGNDNTTMVRGAFAFHRNLGANGAGKFSVGLDAGILQKKINGAWIAPQTLNDPSIPSNQITNAPALNKLSPDFGLGLYYTIPGKMYVGLSTSHIVAQDLSGAKGTGNLGNKYAINFQMARHYYVIAGYTFPLGSS